MDRCEQNLSLDNSTMTEELCINRQLTIAILSPSCKTLTTYPTAREFEGGMRDAIIGHGNLHESGMFLDEILAENIILPKPDKTGVTKAS
ncbi:BgTH12-05454 [Blumeria graminis f. sp. triticale]|uniref:BgTH12-05454 n=2 Tax=Blumeria graminis f. sp. triticale TaxID=1689686 RepID=A0A9W4GGH0_BLUGR|nr:BgTH12-05454 [Blumeria graminis f. sp. triticale]